MVAERRSGFVGYLWGEALPWLGWRGLVRLLVWTGLPSGIVYVSVVTDWDPTWITLGSVDEVIDWVWLFAAIGAIVVTVGPVVGERRRGTAAWVVSQPVSRTGYVVGKVIVHGAGVAVTMVAIPGLVAYAWLPHVEPARGFAVPLPSLGRHLAGLGVVALVTTLLVALVVMLGTLVPRRGPVTGVAAILLIFLMVPISGFGWSRFLPGMLIDWTRPTEMSAIAEYLFGGTVPGEAVAVTAAAIVVCVAIAVVRFRRVEL